MINETNRNRKIIKKAINLLENIFGTSISDKVFIFGTSIPRPNDGGTQHVGRLLGAPKIVGLMNVG